jgi:glycosyltransferase involved in cell wall biosynthesis
MPADSRLSVVYVSYDGALDPLGASQVSPYLRGLAALGVDVTLISFEKPQRWADVARRCALGNDLAAHGVRWCPRPYHARPRLAAKVWDTLTGVAAIRSVVHATRASLVHCRGDVAMAMARRAHLSPTVALLYDMRGFFADERVEGGSWRKGSWTDRLVRREEGHNLESARGIVVLTRRALERIRATVPSLPPHRVIPTCVDLERFRPRGAGEPPEYGLVYAGSLGTWYMVREMVEFARVARSIIPGRPLFLTPDVDIAVAAGATADWAEVRAVAPQEVPHWLSRARASFFFIRPTPSKQASCPTKLAEALAAGLPVAANRGIGDVDEQLGLEDVGVLLESFDTSGYETAARRLAALAADAGVASRCRERAARLFGLDMGVRAYRTLYDEIVREGGRS